MPSKFVTGYLVLFDVKIYNHADAPRKR